MILQSNERGEINVLLIPVVLLSVLFIAAASFAYVANNGRQDYKNNVDAKIAVAVAADKKVVQNEDAAQYAQVAKQPLKTYVGPEAYGTIRVSYPKTWSAYILDSSTNSSNPLDAYFAPNSVPDIAGTTSSFSLRIQVTSTSYDQTVKQYANQLQQNALTLTPYSLPKLPNVIGVRITGQIEQSKQGIMVILPVRDKTLKIWTEASAFTDDFNNNILPNFTFSP